MDPRAIDRRRLLIAGSMAGAAGAAGAVVRHDGELGAPPREYRGEVPWLEGAADVPPMAAPGDARFFTADERAFVVAAIDRLVPPDATGPSASEADVHVFLDRQLAGLYGKGDHFYLGGPWPKGTPQQGYQSRFAPAQLYRRAIAAIDAHAQRTLGGRRFAALAAAEQDRLLADLEKGGVDLQDVDGQAFFNLLLQNTLEGYFSDPIYGGNKGMAAWKMIGFPGAHYNYKDWATRHGQRVPFPPVSIMGRPGWTGGRS